MGESYFQAARSLDEITVGHRIRQDLGDVRPLVESIRLIGFVQPITITPSGAVISGGRRVEAARILGLDTVDVWVRTDITSELDMLLAEQQENQNRKPYTRIEQARFFDQLRRIFTEDAAMRQHATRFGAPDGAPESGAPQPGQITRSGSRRMRASERAALVVTGSRSDYTLEHVVELLRMQDDPALSAPLRNTLDAALGAIEQNRPVEPNYLQVKAVQDTEQLQLLATDGALSPQVRHVARTELAGLPTDGAPSTVRRAAKAALQKATAAKSAPAVIAVPEGRHPPATIRTYTPRALADMVTDLDYWWLHYDPAQVAEALSDEQWEQLQDWVENTARFLHDVARHRRTAA